MSVNDNIRFALHAFPKHEQAARVNEALRLVGLNGLGERLPHQLSGGQQQRVAIARALAPEPPVILLDEPFSNLDTALRDHVRSELRGILRSARTAAIIVTHDQAEALAIADRIALLHEGILHQIGTPEELFAQPRTRFAAAFMGQADFVDARWHDGVLRCELGDLEPVGTFDSTAGTYQILIRYDDIDFTHAESGNATIVERTYEGPQYHYRLQLTSGQIITAKQRHDQVFRVGDRVHVNHAATHPLVYFCGEYAQGTAMPLTPLRYSHA
jgi:iron(III) transport system ATP-binding protein